MALPKEFSRLRIEIQPHCLEVFRPNLPFEPKQFSAASVPLAVDRPILVVIVTLLKMALRIALATGHGTNRKHRATLALTNSLLHWGHCR